MPGNLTFETAVGLLDKIGYKKGQSLEETVDQINKSFDVAARYDDATLESLMQMVDPTYIITAQDQAERPARRARTEQVRKDFFEFLHKKQGITSGVRLHRGMDMLLDLSDDPGAEAHNQRVLKAFAINRDDPAESFLSDDMEERTRIVEEFIDKMYNTDFSRVYHMSDEQVAKEFLKLYSLWALSAEGGDGMLAMNWKPKEREDDIESRHFKLREEYVAKLNHFKAEFQGVMGVLKLRFEHMMDPNYEVVHTERIVPPDVAHLPVAAFSDKSHPLGLRMEGDNDLGVRTDYPLLYYSRNIININTYQEQAWNDQVNRFARLKNIAPENLELVKADNTPVRGTELNSRSIVQMRNKVTGESFLLQGEGFSLVEVDPRKALDAAQKGGDAVIKALENADPWHIRLFTGSKLFEDMKKQMKAVDEAVQKLDRPISEKAFKEVKDLLEDLGKKTKDYLEAKGMSNMYTKDSERLRVAAGNVVQQYVEKTGMLLEANRKADLEIQSKRDKNNDEMKKDLDEEIQFGKARDITRGDRKPVAEEPEGRTFERAKRLLKYYQREDRTDPVNRLGNQIYAGLDVLDGPLKRPRFDAEEVVARMVVYDLVMRERADNKNNGIEGAGAIEERFRKDPKGFVQELAKNTTLQNVVKDMNDADFRRFVDAAIGIDGVQQLTSKILVEQKLQLEGQQPKPDQIIQNQPKAPEVPELPKEHVPG